MSRRNLRESTLLGGGPLGGEEQDPMSSMGNLMDVMLVFACGLLLALVATYNVDLTSVPSATNASDGQRVEGELEKAEGTDAAQASGYTEMGTLYRDEETGELYVVSPSDDLAGSTIRE